MSKDLWYHKDTQIKSHKDLHPECTDIVYLITYTSGHQYIGKKTVRSISTLPVLKTKARDGSELICRHILRDGDGKIITSKKGRKEARAKGFKAKAEYYEKVVTDKPFLAYKGSSEFTKDYIIDTKQIIYQCSDKKSATYLETMLLFEVDALFDMTYLNANIAGTYFDNSLEGLIDI
jgi:hypothetical protein